MSTSSSLGGLLPTTTSYVALPPDELLSAARPRLDLASASASVKWSQPQRNARVAWREAVDDLMDVPHSRKLLGLLVALLLFMASVGLLRVGTRIGAARELTATVSTAQQLANSCLSAPNPSTSSISSSGVGKSAVDSSRPLVLFAYSESDDARANANFFLKHALHDHADFIFILNGESSLRDEIPQRSNVQVIQRENTCYDLGAYGEVLGANEQSLVKRYSRFILMNASVRGPMMPRWSDACWTDTFLGKITDQVKLVGLTMNCLKGEDHFWYNEMPSDAIDSVHKLRHLQAMLLATDRVGLSVLLDPLGLSACHSEYGPAVATEIRLTQLIEHAGYKVEAMMSMWNEQDGYPETCVDEDPFVSYVGGHVPIHEVIFAKTKKLPNDVVEKYTHWARNYDSRNYCRGPTK